MLVLVLWRALGIHETSHLDTTSLRSNKDQGEGVTARQEASRFGNQSPDGQRTEKTPFLKKQSISGRSDTRDNRYDAQSGRSDGRDMEDLPLYWPAGIGPEDLPPWMRDRPEDYLEKVEEVRDETPSSKRSEENNIVRFSGAEPDPVAGYPYSDMVFDPSVTRLYAWFSCDSPVFNGRTKILVKWTQEDTTQVLFEGMGILDTTPYNYIWREDSYWSPGEYSVELYGLEEDLPLLAWGSFEIADLNEHTGFAGLYLEPGDYVSQQTFYLDNEIYLKVHYSSTQEREVQLLVRRVPDGLVVKGGLIPVSNGIDREFTVSLTDSPNLFETGAYVLELFSYPEPQYLMGRNVFKIMQ